MSVDLHIHSTYSDGTFTPEEIIKRAKDRGLQAISITDHDTVEGTEEAKSAGEIFGVEVLSGVELSVMHGETYLHILGYLVDHRDKQLLRKLNILAQGRDKRNAKIVRKLQNLGIGISSEEVMEMSGNGQTGRPHIARVLMEKGVVRNLDQAFEHYLKKGASAYVSREIYSSPEAIGMIKSAGGVAILAHPLQVDPSLATIENIVRELIEAGLDGIEVYYPTHSKKAAKKLKKLAVKYDLAMSGGSDYHGLIRPGTDLAGGINLHVPYEVLDKIKEKQVK